MSRSTMSLFGLALLVGVACRVDAGKDDGPAKEGLVRVYVTDAKGAAVGGDGASVTVEVDYGGFKKSLMTEAKTAKKPAVPAKKDDGAAKAPESHGGQSVTQDGYVVEMVVEPLDDSPYGASPWFESKAPFVAYQDSMKDAPPAEAAGKCKGCGMTMQVQAASFTGVVSVKLKDKTITASGFAYPPADAPKTLEAAANDIERRIDEIEKLVTAGTLADVRKSAEKIIATARLLDRVSPEWAREPVAKIRLRLLATEVGFAAEKADDVTKAAFDCRLTCLDLKILATSK